MIKIAVALYDNAVPATPVFAVFDAERKTMGRNDDNFLVLEDHKHEVSRCQAAVWSDGKHHMLVNLSHATPMRINDVEIDSDEEIEIQVGDKIQIARYLLQVEAVEGVDAGDDDSAPEVANDADGGADDSAPAAPESEAVADSAAVAETAPVAAAPVEVSAPAAPAEAPAATPAAAPAAPAVDQGASALALKQAFLRGAGIPSSAISAEFTPELMEMLGKLMAATLQGTIDLIGLRSLVKQEVKADVTMVVVRNNNPLKFFPDSQTVMMQMLRKKMPGFMEPLEAIEDAYQDLRAHQLGVVAGMRASVQASMDTTLDRLKPEQFGGNLPAPTFMDTLVPSKRQALMWERYNQEYATIAGQAKSDAKRMLGAPFLNAYEKEVERVLHNPDNV